MSQVYRFFECKLIMIIIIINHNLVNSKTHCFLKITPKNGYQTNSGTY